MLKVKHSEIRFHGFPDSTTDFSDFRTSSPCSSKCFSNLKKLSIFVAPRSDVLYAVDARFDSLGHSNSSGNPSPAVARRENGGSRPAVLETDIPTGPYINRYAIIQVVHCIYIYMNRHQNIHLHIYIYI